MSKTTGLHLEYPQDTGADKHNMYSVQPKRLILKPSSLVILLKYSVLYTEVVGRYFILLRIT
jgi:hypothetical protein